MTRPASRRFLYSSDELLVLPGHVRQVPHEGISIRILLVHFVIGICRRFFLREIEGSLEGLGLGSRRDGADWALWGLGGRLAGWPLTEHSDFLTLKRWPGRTLAGTCGLAFQSTIPEKETFTGHRVLGAD